MSEECGICYEEFIVAATTDCLHTVCYSCFLRNRVLCGRKSCLLCSNPIKNAIIYKKGALTLEEIQQHLTHNGRRKSFDVRYIPRYHAIVTADVMSEVNLLDLPPCPICGHHPNNKYDLQEHVRKEHKVEYCRVCIANKPSFMSDQLTYSCDELRRHLAQHPQCPLCRKPQYDSDMYKDHLLADHHRCEICREHGVNDSYWRTANDLIEHHSNDHYVCTSSACRNVMVAFGTKDELLAHQVSAHPELFTQRELEDIQLRLFSGLTSNNNSNPMKQRKQKRRDVTSLIGLNHFSLSNRIQRGEVDTRRRLNNYNTSRIAEDAIFEMHTKLAIKNSLETAKLEQLMREQDTAQTSSLSSSLNKQLNSSIQSIYDPAIELLERHKESFNEPSCPEQDRPPVLVGSMALPGPSYMTENANISNDSLPTATQATLDRFLNKTKDKQNDYSSVSTIFNTNTPTPLSQAELLKRTHERLGVVVKPSKKKKVPHPSTEITEMSSYTQGANNIHEISNTAIINTVTNDDFVQVQDLGAFYGVTKQSGSLGDFDSHSKEQPNHQEKHNNSVVNIFPVDTNTNVKTSVQASLELYQKAPTNNTTISNTNNQQRPNQINGIPVVYKKKKKANNQAVTS